MLGDVVAFNRETDVERLDYQLMMRGPVRLIHMFRDVGSALGYTCHDHDFAMTVDCW